MFFPFFFRDFYLENMVYVSLRHYRGYIFHAIHYLGEDEQVAVIHGYT